MNDTEKNLHNVPSVALPGRQKPDNAKKDFLIGTLPGEGVGPEVISAAIRIIDVFNKLTPYHFEIRTGGKIGCPALKAEGNFLTEKVIRFCETIFSEKGAILCGPGGGRFVYDLRRQFNLFCKVVPVRPFSEINNRGPLTAKARTGVDITIVRENTNGAYFGDWGTLDGPDGPTAFHRFEYSKKDIARIIDISMRLASTRKKKLSVILKPGGIPAISELWQETLNDLANSQELDIKALDIDNAVYQLIADASNFDVIVAPNMFGDILSDCAALLLGSRGMSFSGNFSSDGAAVFQTGHGAAYDLAGTDRANPIGQVLSFSMLLREGFGLYECSMAVEGAIADALRESRTEDIKETGYKTVGTTEMSETISKKLAQRLMSK